MLTNHSHPENMVYINVRSCTLAIVYSIGLDKCIMTCIHHYSTIQSSFIALVILTAPPFKTILKVNVQRSS